MLLKLIVYIDLKNGVILLLFFKKKKLIVYITNNIFSKCNK